MTRPTAVTLFDRAARVFDGWTDPETGVGVLRIRPPGLKWSPGRLATPYQQTQPFRDGGRRVLLCLSRDGNPTRDHAGTAYTVLDLATGAIADPTPVGYDEHSECAVRNDRQPDKSDRTVLLDRRSGAEVASVHCPGWQLSGGFPLADGRRAVVMHWQGKYYDEPCRTHFHLLAPGEPARLFLELDGIFGNHPLACPTDPDLLSYNAWPTPHRYIDGVTSIASVDGRQNYYVPLDGRAPRPGDFWGVRDHYVWTPDGSRIVSYLNRQPVDRSVPFNHLTFDWWLSALDWRTGEDFCQKYPPGRWDGHMQVTPDSRYILCGGGPGFDKLYAVDIAALRDGWNEHIICHYPTTVSKGTNSDPFPYPFALPDGSGVIFNAGWPGPEHGVYLAEWPKELGAS